MAAVNDFIFKKSQDKYYLVTSGSKSLAKLLGYDTYIDSIKNSISSINSELDSLSNTINEIRVQFIGESDTVPSDQANVLFLKRNMKATMFTFTINATPSDATITLNGQTTKSITVDYGTSVNWSVSKSGYTTQSGNEVVTSDITKNIVLTQSGPTEDNPIILESGRKLWRHPNNEGCVLEFNEFGKTTKLFVPDAVYRSTSTYALIPSSNQNNFNPKSFTGAPRMWYHDDQFGELNIFLGNLSPNTDSALQTFLTQTIMNINEEWTAKQYTNTYLSKVPDSPACLFARSVVPTGLGACDVPNLYELCILWLERANIDKYDPTVVENPNKTMENIMSSSGLHVWASTETFNGAVTAMGVEFRAPSIGSDGEIVSPSIRSNSYCVVPVLEL